MPTAIQPAHGEIAYNARGQRVGTWQREPTGVLALVKPMQTPERHKFKVADAWGTDVAFIDRMGPDDGVRFTVPDGTVYWATRSTIETRGFRQDFGYGAQWLLPDKRWDKQAPLPLSQPPVATVAPEPVSMLSTAPREADPPPASLQPTSYILRLTPDVAQRWLLDYRYPHQRPLNAPNVRKIALAIQRGEFPLTTIKLVTYAGQDYLVNGQHRLSAVVLLGQPLDVNIVCEHVTSQEALAQIYAAEDIGRPRTFADSFHAYDLQAEFGFTQERHVRMLSAAVVYFLNDFHAQAGDEAGLRGARLEQMRAWAAEARDAFEVLNGAPVGLHRRLMSAGILSVMLVTLRYQPVRARPFWHRVAHGIELQPKTPEYTLHRYISEHEATGHNRAPIYARVVAAAWNAYFDGRPLQIIRPSDPSSGIVIKGTPYTGKSDAA